MFVPTSPYGVTAIIHAMYFICSVNWSTTICFLMKYPDMLKIKFKALEKLKGVMWDNRMDWTLIVRWYIKILE